MTVSDASRSAALFSSRRAVLAGALGGLGALATGMFGRAPAVRAEGQAIVVGGEYTDAESRTFIWNQANNSTVIEARSGTGLAVHGRSESYIGIHGRSTESYGLYGVSSTSTGVRGESTSSVGVRGASVSGVGVRGTSGNVQGVIGEGSIGVEGNSNSQYAWGVGGYNSAPGGIGVWGSAGGPGSRGVFGYSADGRAVYGETGSGYAGYFKGKVYTTRWYEMAEVGTPNAPSSNRARLFIRDNGSGKTQLCVRFNTGAVQVLATQP